ncbi:hypothetical protein Ddc_12934 [Ditylenchus destructor]|nr:hypothetical protein Ddc_12934 [Ditylenchus destructor]
MNGSTFLIFFCICAIGKVLLAGKMETVHAVAGESGSARAVAVISGSARAMAVISKSASAAAVAEISCPSDFQCDLLCQYEGSGRGRRVRPSELSDMNKDLSQIDLSRLITWDCYCDGSVHYETCALRKSRCMLLGCQSVRKVLLAGKMETAHALAGESKSARAVAVISGSARAMAVISKSASAAAVAEISCPSDFQCDLLCQYEGSGRGRRVRPSELSDMNKDLSQIDLSRLITWDCYCDGSVHYETCALRKSRCMLLGCQSVSECKKIKCRNPNS